MSVTSNLCKLVASYFCIKNVSAVKSTERKHETGENVNHIATKKGEKTYLFLPENEIGLVQEVRLVYCTSGKSTFLSTNFCTRFKSIALVLLGSPARLRRTSRSRTKSARRSKAGDGRDQSRVI